MTAQDGIWNVPVSQVQRRPVERQTVTTREGTALHSDLDRLARLDVYAEERAGVHRHDQDRRFDFGHHQAIGIDPVAAREHVRVELHEGLDGVCSGGNAEQHRPERVGREDVAVRCDRYVVDQRALRGRSLVGRNGLACRPVELDDRTAPASRQPQVAVRSERQAERRERWPRTRCEERGILTRLEVDGGPRGPARCHGG